MLSQIPNSSITKTNLEHNKNVPAMKWLWDTLGFTNPNYHYFIFVPPQASGKELWIKLETKLEFKVSVMLL